MSRSAGFGRPWRRPIENEPKRERVVVLHVDAVALENNLLHEARLDAPVPVHAIAKGDRRPILVEDVVLHVFAVRDEYLISDRKVWLTRFDVLTAKRQRALHLVAESS